MTLGQKIQKLRKERNISQEELAAVLNVSRQALSKWECETSIPEIDKIILLSEYFQVTTDYLLKEGAAAAPPAAEEKPKEKGNPFFPVILSTALIAAGLMIAYARANDGTIYIYWSFSSALWGFIIQLIGVAVFEALSLSKNNTLKNHLLFWGINVWLLTPMPVLFLTGFLYRRGLSGNYYTQILINMGLYLLFNGLVSLLLFVWSRKSKRSMVN